VVTGRSAREPAGESIVEPLASGAAFKEDETHA
jgi:hypothetical protein